MSDVTIRKAVAADIDGMAELLGVLFAVEMDFHVDSSRQKQGLAILLKCDDRSCMLVAEFNQLIIGMCSAQLLVSTAEGGLKAIVEDLVVAAEYRGMGVGRRLLAEIEHWACRQGVKRLDLLADCFNLGAIIPQGPTRLGPIRICIKALTLRSA
ncbi:GNAT family N-acetyltransferase [bacterium BFN5]|nr:GNAT family N-acetyltransferase [bacterium BFN5]